MAELREQGLVKGVGLGINQNQACLDALEIGQWDVFLIAECNTLSEQTQFTSLHMRWPKQALSVARLSISGF